MLFRTIVLLAERDMVLAKTQDGKHWLPEILVPPNARPAYEVTTWLRNVSGVEAIVISASRGERACSVLETTRPDLDPGARWQWVSCDSELVAEWPALRAALTEAPPTCQRGWWQAFRPWAQGAVADAGMSWNGEYLQYGGGFGHQLIQLVTARESAWFKAGDPVEFGIVQRLAARHPAILPPILQSRPEWHGWLMGEAAGHSLREAEAPAWLEAARSMAELQIQEAGNEGEWLQLGCLDLKPQSLLSKVDGFIDGMKEVARRQLKDSPPRLDQTALDKVRSTIECSLADANSIPSSLVHSDPNPGNLFAGGGRCQIIDWAHATFANPFVVLDRLLGHLEKSRIPEVAPELQHAYLRVWRENYPASTVSRAARCRRVIRLATDAFRAARWLRGGVCNPDEERTLRSLCRSILAAPEQALTVGGSR